MRVAILLLAIVMCGPARAQAPGATPPRGMSAPPPPPTALENRREKIKKRIRALRAYTLTEELDLDEQTAGKLFPILARYDDDFDKLLQQRADVMHRLDSARSMKDPRAVDRLIDEAIAVQRGFWDLEIKRLVELRKILAPAQTARLMVVLPELERKIENQLRRAIQPAAKGAAPDDDDVEPDEKPKAKRAKPPCDPFDPRHGC